MDVATRRAWNALQPVSLLPFDVVTRIIRLVADLDPAGWTVTCAGDRRTELGWIESTTHVYSHWRDCALNDRLLWARRACEIPNEEVFDELVKMDNGVEVVCVALGCDLPAHRGSHEIQGLQHAFFGYPARGLCHACSADA